MCQLILNRVEPSVLPAPVEFRNRPAFRPIASQQFNSPFAIQSSLSNKVQPLALRVADPFFGAARFSAFSSLFSNIISSILTPAVTSTRYIGQAISFFRYLPMHTCVHIRATSFRQDSNRVHDNANRHNNYCYGQVHFEKSSMSTGWSRRVSQ